MFSKIVTLQVDEEMRISDFFYGNYRKVVTQDDCQNIAIYSGYIYGLKSNSTTAITILTNQGNVEYKVKIASCKAPKCNLEKDIFKPITVNKLSLLSKNKEFVFGADISTISEVLRCGGKFYNADGNAESVFLQLKNAGINCIRLRLWNDPNFENGAPYGGGHNDLSTDIKIARVANALGFDVMLDFHYSDFWADPQKQSIPKEWTSFNAKEQIEKAIFDYTTNVLMAFKGCGIKIKYVQIGNEITFGMIKHNAYFEGDDIEKQTQLLNKKVRGQFGSKAFIQYINSGISAVNSFDKTIKTIIHIDRGGNFKDCYKFFKAIKSANYDIIGLSYYSFYHGAIECFTANINKLAVKFSKPIIVVETSYAFTEETNENCETVFGNKKFKNKNWEISPQGQANKMRDIVEVLLNAPNNLGTGICYWEPAWLPVKGAGWAKEQSKPAWSDQALFSYEGVALPSLNVFKFLQDDIKSK